MITSSSLRDLELDTYKKPSARGIAGAPVTIHSNLQSVMRYAIPARPINERVQEYQRDVPIIALCRAPTNSEIKMKILTPPPDKEKSTDNNN